MKKLIYPLVALFVLSASAFTVMTSQNWNISEDYSIRFSSGHPDGIFKGLKGHIEFDEKDLTKSKIEVTVDVTTINTGNGMQNTHAKGPQWFDAEKFPVISFTSTQIQKTATGYEARGVLEMHGVKKEIVIPFTFLQNVFSGSFEVSRNLFGIGDPNHDKVPAALKIDLSIPVSKG